MRGKRIKLMSRLKKRKKEEMFMSAWAGARSLAVIGREPQGNGVGNGRCYARLIFCILVSLAINCVKTVNLLLFFFLPFFGFLRKLCIVTIHR